MVLYQDYIGVMVKTIYPNVVNLILHAVNSTKSHPNIVTRSVLFHHHYLLYPIVVFVLVNGVCIRVLLLLLLSS